MSYQLVWFKRDLRCEDHAALFEASKLGPIRCIYVLEPTLWMQPDVALQHFEFIRECLHDLDAQLYLLGGTLEVHEGEVTKVLNNIWAASPFQGLHSHQETGNGFTYSRDQEVSKWCQSHGIQWGEYPQFGVTRGLKNRNEWHADWQKHMEEPLSELPTIQFWRAPLSSALTPNSSAPYLTPSMMKAPVHLQHNPPLRQRGGRSLALKTLNSFLKQRSMWYRGGISSPLSAPDACSRLSVYLTYGCLSIREVVQATNEELLQTPPQAIRKISGLSAFMSRLYWHCHFIQKLESEPEIEWRNMHRGYDALRENEFNDDYFNALKDGKTGWPMVDACVVMLRETGWLNFRMRAMLVSVAAYPLWLHWKPVGDWLATQFLDYEPGIHWSQLQMQSGTTGINVTRVYNPIKQAQDHDQKGFFVRKWLPHMRQVPDTWLFEPWNMPQEVQNSISIEISRDIPQPIVDLSIATKASKDRLHARRNLSDVRAGKKSVIEKHASRAKMTSRKSSKVKTTEASPQLTLEF
ncbi:cryptochrome/deoxyribodipyrimidine photo-lyase family protein [Polynucleobacter sp. AP-Latsch-80-C2]|uniref:cryptochrome/deoxyribodipyrimidine photo-lyase family protein n=1 Tax=Polynucleobacter sp. AP-Latsch-80-C2 TaxID=2576931 RepID=UPI001C0BC3CD|nr:FAD-binding domain-containing protein [Polynucleobacter sp. AP-Latsch-80-C2]MBU3624544.1 deoxyribodipyrimidine photo-lyase [Polynucleobacter sp. AP-Latsch-80-C2]